MVGAKVTYADFALFHVLQAAKSQFAEEWEANKDVFPACVGFLEAFGERPKLKEYLASDRRRAFEGNSMM